MRKTASEEKARKGTGMIPALPLGDLSPEANQNARKIRNNKKLLDAAFRSHNFVRSHKTRKNQTAGTLQQGKTPDSRLFRNKE
jgi:hypothetical protein